MQKRLISATLLVACFIEVIGIFPVMANEASLVSAHKLIKNLDKVIAQVRQESTVPVLFPQKIPKGDESMLYAYSEPTGKQTQGYSISVDYSKDCKGAHYCSMGHIDAQRFGSIQKEIHDREGRHITEKVQLAKNISGYYTHPHAMADYWSPTLQWKIGDVLYTLTWSDRNADQNNMIAMANSALF